MSEHTFNLPGQEGYETDPVYKVSNLGSLFTVCALALDAAHDWCDDIRDRAIDEVKTVLQWGAMLSLDIASAVDKAVTEKKAPAVRMTGGARNG